MEGISMMGDSDFWEFSSVMEPLDQIVSGNMGFDILIWSSSILEWIFPFINADDDVMEMLNSF